MSLHLKIVSLVLLFSGRWVHILYSALSHIFVIVLFVEWWGSLELCGVWAQQNEKRRALATGAQLSELIMVPSTRGFLVTAVTGKTADFSRPCFLHSAVGVLSPCVFVCVVGRYLFSFRNSGVSYDQCCIGLTIKWIKDMEPLLNGKLHHSEPRTVASFEFPEVI